MRSILLQAVVVVTVAFTKEALKKAMGPSDEIPGRSSEARAGMTGGTGKRWPRHRAGRSPGLGRVLGREAWVFVSRE